MLHIFIPEDYYLIINSTNHYDVYVTRSIDRDHFFLECFVFLHALWYLPRKVRWCLSLIMIAESGVLNGAPARNLPLSAKKSRVAGPIELRIK